MKTLKIYNFLYRMDIWGFGVLGFWGDRKSVV